MILAKRTFFTAYNPPPDIPQDYSERTRPKYIPELDEDGVLNLVQHGYEDVYCLIQSHAAECDLKLLLQKCAARGDYSLIEQRKPIYGDLLGCPRDFTDAQNRILLAKKRYDSLSSDTRDLFDSFDDFSEQILTGKLKDNVVKHFTPVEVAPAVEPVE